MEGPAIFHFDQSAYYILFPLQDDEEKGRLILQCALLAGILVLGVEGALLFIGRKNFLDNNKSRANVETTLSSHSSGRCLF